MRNGGEFCIPELMGGTLVTLVKALCGGKCSQPFFLNGSIKMGSLLKAEPGKSISTSLVIVIFQPFVVYQLFSF